MRMSSQSQEPSFGALHFNILSYCRAFIFSLSLSCPFCFSVVFLYFSKYLLVVQWHYNSIYGTLYNILQMLNFRSAKHNYVILQLSNVQSNVWKKWTMAKECMELMRFISFTWLKRSQDGRMSGGEGLGLRERDITSWVNHVFGKKLLNNHQCGEWTLVL